MLKRLDKIRFRGQRPDVFLDLGESPNTSDTECSEDILMKPRPSLEMKDTEELQDPVSDYQYEYNHRNGISSDSFTSLILTETKQIFAS